MTGATIVQMRNAHEVLTEFTYEPVKLEKGYANRTLRIDVTQNTIEIQPVTRQMKDLWIGGKGFDLWLMLQEINPDTKWDSPENPICMSSGPLGGTTAFPGSGKTIVTAISPETFSIMDCNVGGYFGPYLKFAGFDALSIVGKATDQTIVYIDAVKHKITIEKAPLESIDTHLLAEELTEMYADDELDKRNIAVVSTGRGADHARMGVLNFSFWDWRRNVARIKQAGRGGIGTVLRNKKIKALVVKNNEMLRPWSVTTNKMAQPPSEFVSNNETDPNTVNEIVKKYHHDREFALEMINELIKLPGGVTKQAIQQLSLRTKTTKGAFYHILSLAQNLKGDLYPATHQASADIDAYLAKGGYQTLKENLNQNHAHITAKIAAAGFAADNGRSTVDKKLQSCLEHAQEKSAPAYLLCNANNLVNGSLLIENPHAVIEGMLLGALATGAKEGFIYINQHCHANAEHAVAQARQNNLLGDNIQGQSLNFNITVRLSKGGLQADDPTAMLNSLAGKPAESRSQYIEFTEKGFRDQPTVIFNAETWAQLPDALQNEANFKPYIRIAITGDPHKHKVFNLPADSTVKDALEKSGAQYGAVVQVGGPAGGFLPADQLDVKLDAAELKKAGATLGTGSINLIDDSIDLIDTVLQKVQALAAESCGKCTPCREGLFAMTNILKRITNGSGKNEDLDTLAELADTIEATSLCCFGRTASIPVTSSLKYFKEKYQNRINK